MKKLFCVWIRTFSRLYKDCRGDKQVSKEEVVLPRPWRKRRVSYVRKSPISLSLAASLLILVSPKLAMSADLGPGFSECVGAGCRTTNGATYPEPGGCFNADVGAFNNTFRDDGIGMLIGGDFNVSNDAAEAEGRIIVLGNMNVASSVDLYNVAAVGVGACAIQPDGTDAVVVGGNLTNDSDLRVSELPTIVPLPNGNLRVGGTLTNNGALPTTTISNMPPVVGGDPTVAGIVSTYTPLLNTLVTNSATCYGAETATGTISGASNLTFDGLGQSGLIVFERSSDITGTIDFTNVPANATVLVNMTGSGTVTINSGNITNNGVSAGTGGFTGFGDLRQRILWNFPNASDVVLSGFAQFEGSVLTPGNLSLRMPGQNGRVIVGGDVNHDAIGTGSEFHNYDFIGNDLPACTTPPAGGSDFSDAPVSYGSAEHSIAASLYMGECVDDEIAAQPDATANGDDTGIESSTFFGLCSDFNPAGPNPYRDDEDILELFTITDGQSSPQFDVAIVNTTGSDATVKCWIDYNGNGVFENTPLESPASATVTTPGTTATILFSDVPATTSTTTNGVTFMRCRIASNASEVANPTGSAGSGEVEDYRVIAYEQISVCPAGTVQVPFNWASLGWQAPLGTTNSEVGSTNESAAIGYSDSLGNPRTLNINASIIDPDERNCDGDAYDQGFGLIYGPWNPVTFGGADRTPWTSDGAFSFGVHDPASTSCSANGTRVNSGNFQFRINTVTSDEDVTLRMTTDQPVYVTNYTAADIDRVGLGTSTTVTEAPGSSFQDEVFFRADFDGDDVPLNLSYGAQIVPNGAQGGYGGPYTIGVDNNLSTTNPDGFITLQPTVGRPFNTLDVTYSNGPDDAAAEQANPGLYSWWSTPRGATNGASDGHLIIIQGFEFCSTDVVDYGDAPDPSVGTVPGNYNTQANDLAASHTLVMNGLYLGQFVDGDNGTQQNGAATADDGGAPNAVGEVLGNPASGDDEDGVVLPTVLPIGGSSTINVTAGGTGNGFLNAWIDYNFNGVFEPSEQIATDLTLTSGVTTPITVNIPGDALPAMTYARFRYSSAGGDGPTGPAADGEVEDYQVTLAPAVSIGSFVWQDSDGDGVQDAGEPGIANAAVSLLVDNGAGSFVPAVDLSGSPVASQTTTATGLFNFTGLPEGSYRVRVTPPTGFVPTPVQNGSDNADTTPADQLDSNINTTATVPVGTYESGTFDLTAGNEPNESDAATGDAQDGTAGSASDLNGNMTVDMGFIAPLSLGSFIFNDSDGDGIQGSSDLGIQNATVALFVDNGTGTFIPATDLNGNPVANVTTLASGLYEFSNLPPGDYQVQVTPPAGYQPSPIQQTTADDNTENDSNIASEPVPGVFRSPTMTLTSGEEPNESSLFDGDSQDGPVGSLDDLSGNMTVDMGFVAPVSIGSFIWEDVDLDGIQDAAEPGIAGATVALLVEDTNNPGNFIAAVDLTNTPVTTATTLANGLYEFDNLPPGNYRVRVTPPPGYQASPVQDTADNSDMTPADEFDSNIASAPLPGVFESGTFTLSSLGEPIESNTAAGDVQDGAPSSLDDVSGNMTVDMGFVAPLSIGSFVWEDENGNGIQDSGEDPIANAVVSLVVENTATPGIFIPATDISGAPVISQITTGTGLYQFGNLPAGNYRVRVTPPAGFVPSPVQDGMDNSDTTAADELDSNINVAATGLPSGTYESGTFNLSRGGEPIESDAAAGDSQDGNGTFADGNGNMTVDMGFIAPISIGSYVFNDSNGNGTQEPTDTGIENAVVRLFVDNGTGTFVTATDLNGAPVSPVTTMASGLYEFSNLPPGDYQVEVTVPGGLIPTPIQVTTPDDNTTNDSNVATADLGGNTYRSPTMTLTSGGEPNEAGSLAGDTQDGVAGGPDDLSGNMTVDMGFIAPVSIGSFIWEDLNANGTQDSGEPGIENTSVTLLVDDGTGTFVPATDLNGNPVNSFTTGSNGLYEFSNLPPGDYRVRATPPAGLVQSPVQDTANNSDTMTGDELDSNIASEPVAGTFESGTFTLASLGEPNESNSAAGDSQDGPAGSFDDLSGNMTVDMGFVPQMSIGSFVWQDTNGDGMQGVGEPGIPNASVSLLVDNGSGTFIPATDISGTAVSNITTLANGLYEFNNLPPGDYRVRVTPPTDFVPTPVQTTADNVDTTPADELDSNINTSATGVPAGTYESGTFTLSFGDEPNESDTAAGDDEDVAGSAADLNGNMTVDMGFIAPISIGSYVFNDVNGNGTQEPADTGIEDATVRLFVDNGTGTFVPATDLSGATVPQITTLADGLYEFTNLPPGDYQVEVTVPAGLVPTPTQVTTTDDNTQNDSNVATADLGGNTYRSPVMTLTSGGEPNEAGSLSGDAQDGAAGSPDDLSGNMTVDMGFIVPVSIGSFVWEDIDLDGVQDAAEPGIAGATVALLVEDTSNPGNFIPAVDLNNATVANTVTLTDGLYDFENLPPGNYRVRVTPPAGYVESPIQDTADNSDALASDELDSNIASEPIAGTYESGTFTLDSLGEPSESDTGAGDAQDGTAGSFDDLSGNMTVDMGFVAPLSIGSYVWEDENGDGVQDAGEDPITNATVSLVVEDSANPGTFIAATDINGAAVADQITTATGLYQFTNLPTGNYKVQVAPPAGFVPSPVQDGADNSDTLASDELDSNIDVTATGLPAGTYESGEFNLSTSGEPVESDAAAGDVQDGNANAADRNGNMTVDMGFIAPISIGSYIFNDVDGNGIQDLTDTAIQAALVELFVDNGTGTFVPATDLTGAPVASVTTLADGLYEFDNLPPGDYQVQVTPPAAYVPSPVQTVTADDDTENDSNVASEPSAGVFRSPTMTLVSGEEPTEADTLPGDAQDGVAGSPDDLSGNMTVDMGFVVPVSIGSFIWEDVNLDGDQDAGEPGVEGANVALLVEDSVNPGNFIPATDLTGAAVTAVTTTASGEYEFENLPPGNYRVQVTPPAGFIASPVQNTADNSDTTPADELDSNIANEPVAGTYESGTFTLGSLGEPNESDAAAGDAQDGTTGSLEDLSGNMTVDFGFVAPLSLGSFVWQDLNNNGLQDTNEPPLAGTVVTLLVEDASNPGNFVPASDINSAPITPVTVGADGLYQFTNLPTGNYQVQVTPPTGFFPSSVQTTADNDDTENDSNIASEPLPGTFASGVVSLSTLGEPNEAGDINRGDEQDGAIGSNQDLNGNMTVDFAFVPPASIGNYVWLDLDMDGVQDANEDGIAGVEVTLMPPAGVNAGNGPGNSVTTITDANGGYLFPNLPPFTSTDTGEGFVVTVDPGTLPPGLTQTYDEGVVPGSLGTLDNSSEAIQLDPSEEHLTADFGYTPPNGSLGDTIWVDADDDGVQDPGEPAIPGVTVTVQPAPSVDIGNGPGVPVTIVTDEFGRYLITGLPLDQTYIVSVDTNTLPTGYTSSTSGLGDPDVRDGESTEADDRTIVVLTPEVPVILDADFGYLPPADQDNSIGDTLWVDADRDGNGPAGAGDGSDVNEEPLPGVTVSLVDDNGDAIASTITDANGQYLFTGLPDGMYTVVVTDQNNVLSGLEQTFDGDDGVTNTPVTPNRSVVDLDSASASAIPVEDLDQDFGYVDSSTSLGDGSIGDTIFFDGNENGVPDVGEGIEGVSVQLFNPGPDGDITTTGDNVLIATQTTDENGNYLFTGLDTSDTGTDPGTDYQVVVDTSTLPNGGSDWLNTVDPDSPSDRVTPGDSTSITTLTTAEPTDLDQDFGYVGDGNNSLSGTVWPDTDGNGELEESGRFGGVTIELRDEQGNVISTTETDSNGDYEFTGLPDGIYVVVVTDEKNVLNGYEHTDSPNGTSDTSDSTSKDDTGYTVDLDSAGVNDDPVVDTTSDFGYQPVVTNPISLGSFIASSSGDGVQFEWATQTEVSNLGFKLYALVDGDWVQLNDKIILGQGDSVAVQRYSYTSETSATVFALSDIDLTGTETLHGPFKLGEVYGEIGERQSIDWKAEKAEREAKKAERKAKREAQQRQRSRKLKRVNKEVSMLRRHLTESVAAMLLATVNVIVPPAQAQEAEQALINLNTTESGIHAVGHTELVAAGLNLVGIDTTQLTLYNRGAVVPIKVAGSTVFDEETELLFVADQVNTLYTDTNVYTLTLGGSAARITSRSTNINSRSSYAQSYLASKSFAPQAKYSFSSPDHQDPWYAKQLVAIGEPESETVQITLDEVAAGGNSGETPKMRVNVWGASNLPGVAADHHLQVAFNGQNVAQKRFDGVQSQTLNVNLEQVRAGNNAITLTLPMDTGYNYDVISLNEIEVKYPRKFVATDNRLAFASRFSKFRLNGFTPDQNNGLAVTVFAQTDAGMVEESNVDAACSRSGRCRVIFGGEGQATQYYVSANPHRATAAALPVDEDITSGAASYLIISHPDFIGSAGNNLLEDLSVDLQAEYGSVDIVDVEVIYAQFGDHLFDPTAIQRYVQFAYQNRSTRTVLLVGGDVYDYKQFENEDATSFIPSLYASTGGGINFAPVDAKYADINNDNVPDLAIARLPVRTTSQLSTLLAKRDDYLNRTYTSKVLLVADDYDVVQQYDFAADANEIESDFLSGYSVAKAYVDDLGAGAARQKVTSEINQGTTLTAFFGHSSTNQWSFNGLFNGNDAAALQNQGKPTVVTQWGCWNAYYVSPNEDSMGHRFMMEGDKGAIAVMGASTLTDADNERQLARRVFAHLATGMRLGEAVTLAKQEHAQENPEDLDVLLGWTILGLPELIVN